MSIFKKKGTVESLFRMGADDDAKGKAAGDAGGVRGKQALNTRRRLQYASSRSLGFSHLPELRLRAIQTV